MEEQDIQGLQDGGGPFATVNADAVWPNLFGYPNLSTPETRYELRREFYQILRRLAGAGADRQPHPGWP